MSTVHEIIKSSTRRSAGGSQCRLDSWKEIAVYLRREVRTVQRWERFEGLPVRRLFHRRASSVYAFATALDAWLETRSLTAATPKRVKDRSSATRFLPRNALVRSGPRKRPSRAHAHVVALTNAQPVSVGGKAVPKGFMHFPNDRVTVRRKCEPRKCRSLSVATVLSD
jgi:hypothetical protein